MICKLTNRTSKGYDFLNAEGKVVATGKRIGELYYLNCRDTQQAAEVKRGCGMSQEELILCFGNFCTLAY